MESSSTLLMEIINLFKSAFWPCFILLVFFTYKNEIKALLQRFASAGELQMSVGSFALQAKAMKEIHKSIGTNFPDSTLDKSELEAMIGAKIKSVEAAMDYKLTKDNVRTGERVTTSGEIIITNEDGNEFVGTTQDISEAGIGFKSDGRLRFHELVNIKPKDSETSIPMLDEATIVRIAQSDKSYYYGAKVAA